MIDQFAFPEWTHSDYHRVFGDSRDDPHKRKRIDKKNTNWYPNQKPDLDRLYKFKMLPETRDAEPKLLPAPDLSNLHAGVAVCKCGLISPMGKRAYFEATSHFTQYPGTAHSELFDEEKWGALRGRFATVAFTSLAPQEYIDSLAQIFQVDATDLAPPKPELHVKKRRRFMQPSCNATCGNNHFCHGTGEDRLYEDEESGEWFCTKCWTVMLDMNDEEFMKSVENCVECHQQEGSPAAPAEEQLAPEECGNGAYCISSEVQELCLDVDSGMWFCTACTEEFAEDLPQDVVTAAPTAPPTRSPSPASEEPAAKVQRVA
mmetsp:Transcript_8462/g.19019  ORF Transcript_8462/g.19019 Transcript_8462/m.19019 type:complete len:317 (+) Transcript_8462:1-951(+)